MLFYSSRPGKGVRKRDPNKSRLSVFFEIFFRKFWSLCKLNLLYFVTAIPMLIVTFFVVGILSSRITDLLTPTIMEATGLTKLSLTDPNAQMVIVVFDVVTRLVLSVAFTVFLGLGPVTAGFTYVLRNFSREEHTWIRSDYFQYTKSNFFQAIIVWIIDLLIFCALTIAFMFYSNAEGALSYLKYVVLFFTVVYAMAHLYIYQIMITFKLSLKDIFKNSFLFALINVPRNLLLLIILALVHIVVPYIYLTNTSSIFALPLYFILEIVALIAISGFITNYFVYPSLEQYIQIAEDGDSPSEES